ncbi:hypothetical protein RJ639_035969 [Escallonia herrerae]|uniref:Uncharacterized protein n=1 Tax=Escallonia herrerae TaxID=1293975 RepID=A0AA89BC91_9ASTE|nr:hypothetical protein RJ639_035969 [Escallonia herrerae]
MARNSFEPKQATDLDGAGGAQICLGVPVVAMPRWTDRTTNAKDVEGVWCLGLRTGPDEKGIVRRENMESCLREVMEEERGKEIQKNARICSAIPATK